MKATHPRSTTARDTSAGDAFTLIELLVVIAIIAILAGLAFPAVQGALGSSRKAQARNDVAQIVSAVKAFQLEYGRLPTTMKPGSDAPVAANDTNTMAALIGSNASLNPKGIVFFEPKVASKSGKGGLTNMQYKDPWGSNYVIVLDLDYNNKLSNVFTPKDVFFTTIAVYSTAGSTNTNDIISNIK